MSRKHFIARAENALSVGRKFVCGVPITKERYDWVNSHNSGEHMCFLMAKTVPQNWHLPPDTARVVFYVSADVEKTEAWQSADPGDVARLLNMADKIHNARDGVIYRGEYNGGSPTVIVADANPVLRNFEVPLV